MIGVMPDAKMPAAAHDALFAEAPSMTRNANVSALGPRAACDRIAEQDRPRDREESIAGLIEMVQLPAFRATARWMQALLWRVDGGDGVRRQPYALRPEIIWNRNITTATTSRM
jgi:hypothetical protein